MRGKIAGLFTRNWQAKFASLLLAFSLWSWQTSTKISESSINIPVVYKNKPADLTYKSEPPRFLKLKLLGREENLKFSTSSLRAVVDLQEAQNGTEEFKIEFDERQLPENIRIAEFTRRINVQFEAIEEKNLPLRVNLTGEAEDGYRIGRVSINPASVTVEGPASELRKYKELVLLSLDASKLRKNYLRKVTVNAPASLRISKGKEAEISIPVLSLGNTTERLLEIPIKAQGLDPALLAVFSEKTVKIQLQGDREALKKLQIADVRATVDLSSTKFNPRTMRILPYDNEPSLQIDANLIRYKKEIAVLSIIPEKVAARFTIRPEYQKKNSPALSPNEDPPEEPIEP
ncbi:MAG: YbbR-like domain-containing protein [Leptospiraceae bacterium]|nr:YbbR-like domain-containing protein [Leptospiraceae bacterium]